MEKEPTQNISKKPYVKPKLEEVPLIPGENALGMCKNIIGGYSACLPADSNCSPNAVPHS